MTTTHAEAIRTLLTQPACMDAAVKSLEELAGGGNAGRLSDLAGAYYIRAQGDDRPSDLLRSLDAAQRAIEANRNLPAAGYNLALAQEALGFEDEALATWDRVSQLDRSPWAAEARAHHSEILRALARSAATQWRVNRERLPELAERNDRDAVFELIRPFPAAAFRYVDGELLPAWAKAAGVGRSVEAATRLHEASVIASELARATGDPYVHEAIDHIAAAHGSVRRLLVRAHTSVQVGRAFERAFQAEAASRAYRAAVRDFARAGSPLQFGAELAYYTQLTRREDKRQGQKGLAALEARTRDHYRGIWAFAQSNRGYVSQMQGRYLEAIALYDEALAVFRSIGDQENIANVHVRKAGICRVLGHQEAALAETLLARRHAAQSLAAVPRNLLTGETAETAVELGFPQIALQYHSAFLDWLIEQQRTGPQDAATTAYMRLNRAVALRGRAAVRLRLGQRDAALSELREASSIAKQQTDAKISNAVRARIAEVRGDAAMPNEPKVAIEAFSQALALAGTVRYRTFQAILLARRAEAHRLNGDRAAAEADLISAIAEVNAEETELLRGRTGREKGEGQLWSEYFSRFQESYGWLIRVLAAEGKKREAFAYTEKARAYEPLKLVLELPVDEVVRSLDTPLVNPKALDAIQAALPEGTFIVEYHVTGKDTFAWIVSHDDFAMEILPVGQEAIENWTRTLQRNAALGSRLRFENGLGDPFDGLLRVPLASMSRMKNGKASGRRLVIVPDRFTHGLPFAALYDKRTRRFLIEDFPVAVAPSAALYIHALTRDAKLSADRRAPSALLVGDPAFNEGLDLARGLERLQEAGLEAQELAALYGPGSHPLVEGQATVAAFLSLAKDSTIVHVAGHAVVNRHAPFGTLLLMAPSRGHNGLLYADELLTKLRLDHAQLVVLAACSSAGGSPVGPEGLAPLVRPFVASGVPGIVGSLWTINDRRSRKVLVEFHRHYRDGHDAVSALQLAQVHFLKEQREGIPVMAWGAFQAVGFASSPYSAQHRQED